MADATYDAIVIGAGAKGIVVGMYLARYGGMNVAVFERRHEAGGGWATEEGPAPGFLADLHATGIGGFHFTVMERDFPEWREMGADTFETIGSTVIFSEDDTSMVTYNRKKDPSRDKTYKEIARFSERDAETFLNLEKTLQKVAFPAILESLYNPPTPLGVPDAVERLFMDPSSGIPPHWAAMSTLQIARELYDSGELIGPIARLGEGALYPPEIPGVIGLEGFLLGSAILAQREIGVRGGSHMAAHAASKIIHKDGGEIWTKAEVVRIIIENGEAMGVVLADGSEVRATQFVVSTLDPAGLVNCIGKENLDPVIVRKVERIEKKNTIVTWYTFALHEQLLYNSSDRNPDTNQTGSVLIMTKDDHLYEREIYNIRSGHWPDNFMLNIIQHSIVDKSRVPKGKASILTEQFVPHALTYSEDEWLKIKSRHANELIDVISRHSRNGGWDNVIGYYPETPDDYRYQLPNMGFEGNEGIIDLIPAQSRRFRPIPEWSGYKVGIKNLYATGGAWPPTAGTIMCNGYNCYKVIAEDFGLSKPWEGSPF